MLASTCRRSRKLASYNGRISDEAERGKLTLVSSGRLVGMAVLQETGQSVTHLIEENGRFAQAVAKLLIEHPAILYHDRSETTDPARKKKAASKTKYTCPTCGLHAWAKPNAPLMCGRCFVPLQAPENGEEGEANQRGGEN